MDLTAPFAFSEKQLFETVIPGASSDMAMVLLFFMLRLLMVQEEVFTTSAGACILNSRPPNSSMFKKLNTEFLLPGSRLMVPLRKVLKGGMIIVVNVIGFSFVPRAMSVPDILKFVVLGVV